MADDSSAETTRRQFFRLLGRQTTKGAGDLFGTVNTLRRTSAEAAGALLGWTDERPPFESGTFRSPYRYVEGRLLILDQRQLPERIETISCHDPNEVAAAMRAGAVGGGPVLGQLAAHAAAQAVAQLRNAPAQQRRSALGAATATLRAARPTQQAIRHALSRIESVDQRLADDVDGATHARALFDEAEAISLAAALDHGRLGRAGADHLGTAEDAGGTAAPARPLALLVHGDGGALSGGIVGTSFAVVSALVAAGRNVHAWLTEAAPSFEGARLGARQLTELGIPHTVVADTAVSWLLDHRPVDAVLLRADWVCANGDVAAPLGSLNVARLAAPVGVPVYACAALSMVDTSTRTGEQVPAELRAPADGAIGPRLDPAADVVPAELLTGLLSDAGVLRPPYGEALAAAVAANDVEAAAMAQR
ncbi:MAG: hypothetical protein M3N29_00950 [Chloroflexota bacterium]|nr:hypothetical protein [Chloroflexota bacterium]